MRLIQAAVHNAGILRCISGGRGRADRCRRRRRSRGRHNGALLRGVLDRRGCRRLLLGVWRSLAVGNEFCIAGSARPWRHIGGQAAGPMRPVVGDKATAAGETKSNSEESCRCNAPLEGHQGCRMSRAKFQSVGMDSIRGGTMVRKSHAL